jgi:DNA-binding MarR family transcriptional regulator
MTGTGMKPREEIISQVLELFQTLAHNRMRYQKEPWRRLVVPLAQLKSLFLINIRGSVNVRELAQEMGVTPGNVTSIVNRLVGQELVRRSEGPGDRRIVLLHLTEKGRRTIVEIQGSQRADMKRFLERMTAGDISALYRGMSSFLAAMEQDWKESARNKTEDITHTHISSPVTEHVRGHHLMHLS